jgi:hypothetical protein
MTTSPNPYRGFRFPAESRHRLSASDHRYARDTALRAWRDMAGVPVAA